MSTEGEVLSERRTDGEGQKRTSFHRQIKDQLGRYREKAFVDRNLNHKDKRDETITPLRLKLASDV